MATPDHPHRRHDDPPRPAASVPEPRRQQLRVSFIEELNALEASALGGFDMLIEQFDRVSEALRYGDARLASLVVADDDRLDGRYLEVNQGILSLLARQAPVAGHLRLVAAMLHLIKHIERMGDQCVNIAKLVPIPGHDAPQQSEVVDRLGAMCQIVRREVVQARQAFELRDVDLARNILGLDSQVNVLNREIFRFAIDLGDDADTREWLLTMAMVARALERIGDNAVDIAELVAFVTEGLFREFGGLPHGGTGESHTA